MARNTRRLAGVLLLTLALAVALPTAALAGKKKGGNDGNRGSATTTSAATAPESSAASSSSGCGYTSSQIFAAYGDLAQYYLAPGGDAESSLWARAGGAAVVPGTGVLGTGKSVYALPAGGSVTSGSFCITYDSPTMRFSVKDPGVAGATLRVEVLWTSPTSGTTYTVPVAKIQSGTAGVRLCEPVFLIANLAAFLSGTGTTNVQLRFTAEGGSWQVDDVHVDPFKRV